MCIIFLVISNIKIIQCYLSFKKIIDSIRLCPFKKYYVFLKNNSILIVDLEYLIFKLLKFLRDEALLFFE